jgi:hypothetical protein
MEYSQIVIPKFFWGRPPQQEGTTLPHPPRFAPFGRSLFSGKPFSTLTALYYANFIVLQRWIKQDILKQAEKAKIVKCMSEGCQTIEIAELLNQEAFCSR